MSEERCLCDHGKDVHADKRCLSSLTGFDHLPCGCPGFEAGNRLLADVERLEMERDGLRGEVENADASYTAQREAFEVQLVRAMNAEAKLEQAEAQRDEAEGHLRAVDDKEHIRCHCNSHFDARTYLARLTEKGATDGMEETPERREHVRAYGHGGHVCDTLCYPADQPCKRVSVCTSGHPDTGFEKCTYLSDAQSGLCHMPQQTPKCDRHGCPWPEEGPCPALSVSTKVDFVYMTREQKREA